MMIMITIITMIIMIMRIVLTKHIICELVEDAVTTTVAMIRKIMIMKMMNTKCIIRE